MSDITPLRSIVFLGLVLTSTLLTSLFFNAIPGPVWVVMAIGYGTLLLYLSSVTAVMLLIMPGQTEDCGTMTTHFVLGVITSILLCFGRPYDKDVTSGREMEIRLNLVIWTVTCGMVSAIWMREGLRALKREAMAVPGNLWLALYESKKK